MKRLPACVIALSISGATGAQDRPFEVVPAHHTQSALRFRASQEIDWLSLASEEMRALQIPSRDSAVIARFAPLLDMFGGVEVDTAIVTPRDLAARRYYFAGTDGIREMAVDSTRVVTRLEFDSRSSAVQGRQSWGELYGSPNGLSALAGGGFVLHSERPLSFQTSPSGLTADELLTGSNTVQQTPAGGYWGRGTPFWEIEAQYRFIVESVAGDWVFVQWAPDREMIEAGCRFRYDLFQITPGGPATRVAWAAYGCDV